MWLPAAVGKAHVLKIYAQFALNRIVNTTGSINAPVVQFHEIIATKNRQFLR